MIVLKRNEENLNEVVVNKGYYTEKQRYTVGNVGHIDAKVIEQQPVQNPLLAIQGRATGIEITQLTGINGGGVKVRIQGRNSIRSGNDQMSSILTPGSFREIPAGQNINIEVSKGTSTGETDF